MTTYSSIMLVWYSDRFSLAFIGVLSSTLYTSLESLLMFLWSPKRGQIVRAKDINGLRGIVEEEYMLQDCGGSCGFACFIGLVLRA